MKIKDAIVMAAGAGTRLKPITNTRPKSMIKLAGKPILHHLLLVLQEAGLERAFIVVKYKQEVIKKYFENLDPLLKIKLEFIEQKDNYGTAAAVLEVEDKISSSFLAIAGDIVTTKQTVSQLIKEHQGNMTLVVKKEEHPENYGFAILKNGYVERFEEKPSIIPKESYVNCSIYAFEPEIFSKIKNIKKSARGEYEITDLFVSQKAKAVISSDYWIDMGLPWQLFDANKYLLENLQPLDLGEIENSKVKGKLVLEKGAKIIDSYIEGNVYIGKKTTVGPHSYIRGDSSIGDNCNIGDSTTIKNSIIFDNVNAKHLTYIGDSIIGENCNFGAGTQIANFRFDKGKVKAKVNEVTIDTNRVKLGAIIGDDVKTGVLSSIMPGKMIGNNSWIGAGVIIKENIEPNTHVELEQKLKFSKVGGVN